MDTSSRSPLPCDGQEPLSILETGSCSTSPELLRSEQRIWPFGYLLRIRPVWYCLLWPPALYPWTGGEQYGRDMQYSFYDMTNYYMEKNFADPDEIYRDHSGNLVSGLALGQKAFSRSIIWRLSYPPAGCWRKDPVRGNPGSKGRETGARMKFCSEDQVDLDYRRIQETFGTNTLDSICNQNFCLLNYSKSIVFSIIQIYTPFQLVLILIHQQESHTFPLFHKSAIM